MSPLGSIFFEFNLPNAATWFYFSLLLAVALFYKFTRLLSMRNWDILTLFLLVPGLLLLQEAHSRVPNVESLAGLRAANLLAAGGHVALNQQPGLPDASLLAGSAAPVLTGTPRLLWLGYLWLLCGSAYFLIRCLFDLALVQRPALAPNRNVAGLAWLAGALFVCLAAVSVRKPDSSPGPVGKRSAAVSETQRRAEDLIKLEIPVFESDASATSFWVERTLAMLCHLAIVAGLIVVGYRHFHDATAGMAAATFYLLLPYTAYHVEQFHHVWPAVLLVWAVAAYRMPAVAGGLLGVAAGTVYFPALLFPLWLSFYWRRGAGRFLAAFVGAAGICLAGLGVTLWADGQLARVLQSALSLADWQPWVAPSANVEGFWTGLRWAWAYRLPVAIGYVAFLLITVFWPRPKNLAHVLALSAALLLGIQFWYADQGGVYVLWYLPLLLLVVFRPNLADKQPAARNVETSWPGRLSRALVRLLHRVLRLPEPAAPVS